MKSILVFLFIGLFTFTSLGQPIYFESDIVIDTSTVDLMTQEYPDFDIDHNDNLCIVWTERLTNAHSGVRHYITSILSSDGGDSFYAKTFVQDDPLPHPNFGGSRGFTKISYDNFGNPIVGWREVSNYLVDGWVDIAKSNDGGISFPASQLRIHDREATFNWIFKNNNFYVSWHDNQNNRIHLGISSDGGITFDTVTTVVDLTAMGWSIDVTPISLVLDNNQNLSIFWTSFSPLRKLWLSKSIDGGINFAPADTFLNYPHKQIGCEVVLVNEEYYMLFWGFINPDNSHVYFTKSFNNQQNFSDPRLINNYGNYDIDHNPLTGLLLLVRDTVYRSRDFGDTFPDTAFVEADSGFISGAWRIKSDSRGNVFTIGQRVPVSNFDDVHIVLNKTNQLVAINRPATNSQISSFILKQNYPNPFNGETIIEVNLLTRSWLKLAVYDLRGRIVFEASRHNQSPGTIDFRWKGLDQKGHSLSSGVYFYTVSTSNYQATKKLLLLK